jgi:enterochelin esterase-like enzyme
MQLLQNLYFSRSIIYMPPLTRFALAFTVLTISFISCKTTVKEQEDTIYSRHLQRHVRLSVIATPMPDKKEEMNLLLFVNGQDIPRLEVKAIIDSLYKKKLLQPVTVVGIDGEAAKEYGLSGLDANKAEKFSLFVDKELYPFIKKKVVIRTFRSIAIAGCDMAAISALDIAWNNAGRISRLGLFSPRFGYAGYTDTTNNALRFLQRSRKRPRFETWMYAPVNDTAYAKDMYAFETLLAAKKISSAESRFVFTPANYVHPADAWRDHFADFLLWAFGK